MKALVLICVCLLSACGGETAGALVMIEMQLQGAPGGGAFETDTGYSVELDEAWVRVGPVFAFAPEPMAHAPSFLQRVSDALVPVARAHGGVDLVSGRRVRAELLEPETVSILPTDHVGIALVEAEAGDVDAITIELARQDDEGPQLYVRGRATRDGEALDFEGELTLPDGPLERRIELVRQHMTLTEGGRLTVQVHASAWLQDAEFARSPVDDDGVAQLTPDSQAGRALKIGARSPEAFSIEWSPEP